MKRPRASRSRVGARPRARARPTAGAARSETVRDAAWREWVAWFGRRLRRVRTSCGLSQQDVAGLAGVSQGAVSRLEAGHGLATPLLLVVKIDLALARHVAGVDPLFLDAAVACEPGLSQLMAGLVDARPLGADPATEELVRLYHRTPVRLRRQLLAIVRAAASALDSPDA
jgi:transcriptional regulator with XRE-family HTH domain